jgi:D-sedoheptulose 7-phosphate isomerase
MTQPTPFADRAAATFSDIAANFIALRDHAGTVGAMAEAVIAALTAGNTIYFCGNGGSAADSQHLAAELLGRYRLDRAPLPAVALTVDTSALTAIGNDFGFDEVFERQLRGLARRGDVLVALTTSGNSPNVMKAVHAARAMGVTVLGLTGGSGGALKEASDIALVVPAQRTDRIQEMHIACGHMICEMVEEAMVDGNAARQG